MTIHALGPAKEQVGDLYREAGKEDKQIEKMLYVCLLTTATVPR